MYPSKLGDYIGGKEKRSSFHKDSLQRLFISSIVIFLLILTSILLLTLKINKEKTQTISKAKETGLFDTSALSSLSYNIDKDNIQRFSLYKEKGYLYKSENSGPSGIAEFLNRLSSLSSSNLSFQSLGNNISSSNKFPLSLPKDFLNNSKMIKYYNSQDDNLFFEKQKLTNPNIEHVSYQQMINGIPVYGGNLSLHLRNNNEVYLVSGVLLKDKTLPQKIISEEQTKEIALSKAKEEEPSFSPFKVTETKEYILNLKLLGIFDDTTNYHVLAVTIIQDKEPSLFAKEYFVDLESGRVVYSQELIKKSLIRKVLDGTYFGSFILRIKDIRVEGNPPTGNEDVDSVYDSLGKIYNFFHDTFGRDSYDNHGAPIVVWINNPIFAGLWSIIWKIIIIGPNYSSDERVRLYILTHEFTHGVIHATADFGFENQSAALDEAIAHVFGWTIAFSDNDFNYDFIYSNEWPDRLFSLNYQCNELEKESDFEVLAKTMQLIIQGTKDGSFNGCTISGIGKDKTLAIIYWALISGYLKPNSNFKDAYRVLIQSCNDLYGRDEPNTCNEIKKAMQATEMDQQPIGEQRGAKCLGITPKTPACALPSPTPDPDCTRRGGFCDYPDSCLHGIITDTNCNSQNPGFICCRRTPVGTEMPIPTPGKIELKGIVKLYKDPGYDYKTIYIRQGFYANKRKEFSTIEIIDLPINNNLQEIEIIPWSWKDALLGEIYEFEASVYRTNKSTKNADFDRPGYTIVKASPDETVELIIDDRKITSAPTATPP